MQTFAPARAAWEGTRVRSTGLGGDGGVQRTAPGVHLNTYAESWEASASEMLLDCC